MNTFKQPEPVQKGHKPDTSPSILQLGSSPMTKEGTAIPEPDTIKQILKCTECEMFFLAPWALKRHMTKHTGQKDWLCHMCKKQFTRKENLKLHIARYHP